jgi:hypothetical protein
MMACLAPASWSAVPMSITFPDCEKVSVLMAEVPMTELSWRTSESLGCAQLEST